MITEEVPIERLSRRIISSCCLMPFYISDNGSLMNGDPVHV